MKWSNAAHNGINVLIALLAALTVFDWTAFLDPETAMKVVGALALTKLVINAIRDGLSGMVAEQPPVRSDYSAGS